jgi:hypothetical protein
MAQAVAAVLPSAEQAAAGEHIDIAKWFAALPINYAVSGAKNEPAYLEAIDIERRGDIFTIVGGAPAWEARSTETIAVASDGARTHLACPPGMVCDDAVAPSGFLASAALLSSVRKGVPLGTAEPVPFGERFVLCIGGERLGIVEPILDPCFDQATGAVLAQRHRLSGDFDGPSLDPWSVRVRVGEAPAVAGKPGS